MFYITFMVCSTTLACRLYMGIFLCVYHTQLDDVDSGGGGEPVRSGLHVRVLVEAWLTVDLTEGQERGMRDGMT